MATLTGFTRGADPIHAEQLRDHISSVVGKTVGWVELTPTEAIVTGNNLTELDRIAIQAAILGYSFTAPSLGLSSAWGDITNKPSTYTPSTHTHSVADVTNLQSVLDAKVNTEVGKGLSTEDYTTADKTKLAGLSGNYRTLVTLGADVTNNNAVANTIADVTGLSFPVVANTTYRFYFLILYTAAATTTGSRWTINGPATTLLAYTSTYSLTATSESVNHATAYNIPAASNASSANIAGNIAIIEGVIRPSANGTVIARFASEVANSAIVAKAGSTVEYW